METKSPHTVELELPSEAERDEQALARLGKKPILKARNPIGNFHHSKANEELATVLLPVHVRIYMYHLDHMGS